MKAKTKIISLLLMLYIGICVTPQKASAQSVTFQVFYDELSPYGTWVQTINYGYVWVPDAGAGFIPYSTNGYWVYTNAGWTWVSDYAWGWAPFHYGRWYFDPMYGHIWVPGNEWGPGWVVWRSSPVYYGWAPLGPGNYNVPHNHYTFVRCENFGRTNIHNYYINRSNNVTVVNNSTVINNPQVDKTHNVTYNAGPSKPEIEKRGGKPVMAIPIKEINKPGQSVSQNQLQLYKPQMQIGSAASSKPAKVTNLKDVKPAAQRTMGTSTQKPTQPVNGKPFQEQQSAKPVMQQSSKPQQGDQPKDKPTQLQPIRKQGAQHPSQVNPVREAERKAQQQTKPLPSPGVEKPRFNDESTKPRQGAEHPSQVNPVREAERKAQQQTKPLPSPGAEKPRFNDEPAKPQPVQPQRNIEPIQQQRILQQETKPFQGTPGDKPQFSEPIRTQPIQQQPPRQPMEQQRSQPQQQSQPHQSKPPQGTGGDRKPK